MKIIIILLTAFLIIPTVGYSQAAVNKDLSSAKQTLAKLRASLDRVKKADDTKPYSAAIYDPSPLIGLTRTQITSSLGAPNICETTITTPCEGKGNWFYVFYKLPKLSVGGGPVLILKFGKDNACNAASWVFMQ